MNRTVENWNSLPAETLEPFPKSLKGFLKNLKKMGDCEPAEDKK